MKKLLIILFLSLSTIGYALEVTVSIVPQKYFIEKIAQDKVKVNVMVQPGFSPATYEPKTSQMKKIASSSIYFSTGVPFENVWLERFKTANNKMEVIDTTSGIEKLAMAKHEHHDEDEHHEHETHKDEHDHHDDKDHVEHHEHEGLDPHVWLDPLLVKIQAKNIYMALVKHDGQNRQFYQQNYEQFLREIDELYKELKDILKPVHDKAFMVYHPSWGYFAKRFHLEQIAVEIEGKEPKPNQLVELIEEAQKHDIKIMFVAPQFSQKSAKVIAQNIKGDVVMIDHLSENWSESLIQTAKAIVKSYQ